LTARRRGRAGATSVALGAAITDARSKSADRRRRRRDAGALSRPSGARSAVWQPAGRVPPPARERRV